MKYLFLFFILFIVSCSEEKKPLEAKEQVQGDSSKPTPVILEDKVEEYPDGSIRAKFTVNEETGYRHGKVLTYAKEGFLQYDEIYAGGFVVQQKELSKDGLIIHLCDYENDGPFRGKLKQKKYFHKDGKSLKSIHYYTNNQKSKVTYFHKSGSTIVDLYANGEKVASIYYRSDASYKYAYIYKDGQKTIYKIESDFKSSLANFGVKK